MDKKLIQGLQEALDKAASTADSNPNTASHTLAATVTLFLHNSFGGTENLLHTAKISVEICEMADGHWEIEDVATEAKVLDPESDSTTPLFEYSFPEND